MVQLRILSGKKAGTSWVTRRFPVRIGRANTADLQADEDGVWDEHLVLDFDASDGVQVRTRPEAPVILNGESVEQEVLRNGDVIELGALKLQFWLAELDQRGLGWREAVLWAGIAAICAGQIALIYCLPN